MTNKPPIHCTPCRVCFNGDVSKPYFGDRFQIEQNGEVRNIAKWIRGLGLSGLLARSPESFRFAEARETIPAEPSDIAKAVRREAARQRRNRNARERSQAMRDLGLKRTPYGWE